MNTPIHPLYSLLEKFDAAKVYYRLARMREDTVMIEAQTPGRHYEIEVFSDGRMEVERFQSNGVIGGQDLVDEILRDSIE